MDAVFLALLNRSIAAGWLICAAVLLRLMLRSAPRWTVCLLWGVVALRLVLPVFPESPLSLIPSSETLSPAAVQYARRPAIDSGISFINDAVNPVLEQVFAPAPVASANPLHIWILIAGILWAVGCAALLLYGILSALRMRTRMAEAIPLRDGVWLCDAAPTPFILGLLRPKIYLPSGMEEETAALVLAHERAHLARRDHWWKALAFLLLAVYWFSPLVWLSYFLFVRDIELTCDERVLRNLDAPGRKAYCAALVRCAAPRRWAYIYPVSFGEGNIKRRIQAALRGRRPKAWRSAAALAVCAAAALCFLTNPARDTGPLDKSQGVYSAPAETDSFPFNPVLLQLDTQAQEFSLSYDILSSYFTAGTYSVAGSTLRAVTFDGQYTYSFQIRDAETLVFQAQDSSPLTLVTGEAALADGAVLRFVPGAAQ